MSAESLCQEADRYMLQAKKTYPNNELVAKASQIYLAASEADPLLAGPYLGLAHITYALGKQKEALGLLLHAQVLEPYNLKVIQLLRSFQKHPPPAPLADSKVKPLNRGVLTKKVQFNKAIEKSPKPRIFDNIGLKPDCVQEGEQVVLLQKALKAVGFSLATTGIFDKKTLKALQTYQYKQKLPVTGFSDKKTNTRLNQILDKLDENPACFEVQKQPVPESEQVTSIATEADISKSLPMVIQSELGPTSLKGKIDSGPEVFLLQETLAAMGFVVDLTWQYDTDTSRAVRAFQTRYKLPLTGWIDAKTREQLNPLIQVVIHQKERFEEIIQTVHLYWETQNKPQKTLVWEKVLQDALKKIFALCETCEEHTPKAFPVFPDKPLIQHTLGSPDLAHTVSEGAVIQRLQTLLANAGLEVSINGSFDLQTLVAVRQFLKHQGFAPEETVSPNNWDIFNQQLKARYHQERIREQLLQFFYEWCQFRQFAWFQDLENTIQSSLFPLLEYSFLPIISEELGPAGRQGKKFQGIEVYILQHILQEMGYASELTGVFDTQTQTALKSWQQDHHLAPNGLLDKRSHQLFNQQLQALFSSEVLYAHW